MTALVAIQQLPAVDHFFLMHFLESLDSSECIDSTSIELSQSGKSFKTNTGRVRNETLVALLKTRIFAGHGNHVSSYNECVITQYLETLEQGEAASRLICNDSMAFKEDQGQIPLGDVSAVLQEIRNTFTMNCVARMLQRS